MELFIHLLASQVYFLEECFFTAFTAPEFLISKVNLLETRTLGRVWHKVGTW